MAPNPTTELRLFFGVGGFKLGVHNTLRTYEVITWKSITDWIL